MGFQLDNISSQQKTKSSDFDVNVLLQKEIVLFKSPFSNKIKESFYTELAVLLKAGINLKDALTLAENSQKKQKAKTILSTINEDIISGKSLSEAIEKQEYFSNYEFHSLKIGEETGALAQVMEQLGEFYSRKNEQKRQLISALSYPIIVCTTAIIVVIFMLNFVVPIFEDIFKQQQVELPAVTQFIINCSDFLKANGFKIILFVIGLFALRIILNKKKWFQQLKDSLILRIPVIGDFVRTVYLSQFTQAVALLTSSKVPIVNSINLVGKMINFHPLQTALKQIENDILIGDTLSEGLSKHSIFDDRMLALVKVAEETNKNEFIFKRLNTHYNTQVQQRSKILSTILEPLIIMFVGAMVAVILVAMYLPMFRLSSVLG